VGFDAVFWLGMAYGGSDLISVMIRIFLCEFWIIMQIFHCCESGCERTLCSV